ncbi:hypothetical protein KCP71_19985 [Salmonella enterica subsp. enterica]|nr:hypothetical protein KCP71_19985 [Salmonella enterica subsp. enterica]
MAIPSLLTTNTGRSPRMPSTSVPSCCRYFVVQMTTSVCGNRLPSLIAAGSYRWHVNVKPCSPGGNALRWGKFAAFGFIDDDGADRLSYALPSPFISPFSLLARAHRTRPTASLSLNLIAS